MWVGSDHEAIVQQIQVTEGKGKFSRRPNTRPKRVCKDFVLPDMIDQQALNQLARECTKPYEGIAYRDSDDTKALFRAARNTKAPEDWKRALHARDHARKLWRQEHIEAATKGNWQAYREVVREGTRGWEDHFATTLIEQGQDPHHVVHSHFEKIYQGNQLTEFPFEHTPPSPDFTAEELEWAINQGKGGKSTGGDGVPHELLVAISKEEGGLEKIPAWFNRLLHGEEPIPSSWANAVMVILPKCAQPETPKHLRPICLGSASSKVYARMLLQRSKASLRYSGPFQNMGEGRQTVDYIWVISRLMTLEREWKYGLYFLKLDIAKAFDTVHREKMLQRLATKMGNCEELRSWWEMFSRTEASLDTVWGSTTVPMASGIRQGSVESPLLFAAVMDWVVQDVAAKHRWQPHGDVYQGLGFAESAFVDDCILWNGKKHVLERRTSQLLEELRLWGLHVNPEKCQAYASPYVQDRGDGLIRVGDYRLRLDDKLDVMSIPFRVGITAKEALQAVFHKVKGKFWS